MTKAVRVGLIIAAVAMTSAAILLTAAFALMAGWVWIRMSAGITTESPAVTPPLASMLVERRHGQTTTIHATLAQGYRIENTINIRLFDGFDPGMSPEEAERRHGPPTGHWRVPHAKAPAAETWWSSSEVDILAPYYDGPEGRITLRPRRTPDQGINWIPVGYPRTCTPEYLFTDARLRAQIVSVLPAEGAVELNVHASHGWGGTIVSLNRFGCQDIELGWNAHHERLP